MPSGPPAPIAAVLNPVAGNGRAGRHLNRIRRWFECRGLNVALHLSEDFSHLVALATDLARSFRTVLAIGGDGTVHGVANGLLAAGVEASLGIIPLGTGNDLTRALDWPTNPEQAVQELSTARSSKIDYGMAGWIDEQGRRGSTAFVNAVGVGFDAAVAASARSYKIMPGSIGAYLVSVLQTLGSWSSPGAVVEWDADGEQVLCGKLLLMTVSNGTRVGGGFYLTPDAIPDDGLLDMCLVRNAPARRVLQILPRVIRGGRGPANEPEVDITRLTQVRLVVDAPMPLHADGEILEERIREITVEVVPGGLSVLQRGKRHATKQPDPRPT